MVANDKPALIWSPEALTDLDTIWDFYLEAAGRHTAEKWSGKSPQPAA